MKIYDPFLFLFGNKESIKRIAGSYWSLLIGFLLVLTAGVARNYDHLIFLNSKEWIIGPVLASLASCTVVYLLGMRRVMRHKDSKLSFLSFLTVYWMTAPCAWLYAIPVESYTDIITATKWNVAFLAIVAAWRVVLMIRCLCVLTEMKLGWAILSIMLPAALVSWIGSLSKGMSLVGIMGGVRLPPDTQILKNAADTTMTISFFLAIILLIIKLTAYRKQPKTYPKPLPWKKNPPFPKVAFLFSISLLAIGVTAPYNFQKQLSKNKELESLIQSEDYLSAIQYVKEHQRSDFSHIHYFPPKPSLSGYDSYPDKLQGLLKVNSPAPPPWALDIWRSKYTEEVVFNCLRADQLIQIQSTDKIHRMFLKEIDGHMNEEILQKKGFKKTNNPRLYKFSLWNRTYQIEFESDKIQQGLQIERIFEIDAETQKAFIIWPEIEDRSSLSKSRQASPIQ